MSNNCLHQDGGQAVMKNKIISRNNMTYTRRELKTFLLVKLNSLYSDVNSTPERTAAFMEELKRAREDRRAVLMDIYAGYYAPEKVTDYSGLPKRQCDMTGEMLDFSSGFDKYIASIEEEYNVIVKQKREAVALLSLILSLKQPYSRILYLRYYKRLSPEDASEELHIARSTMFRKRNVALGKLAELFAAKNDIVLMPD